MTLTSHLIVLYFSEDPHILMGHCTIFFGRGYLSIEIRAVTFCSIQTIYIFLDKRILKTVIVYQNNKTDRNFYISSILTSIDLVVIRGCIESFISADWTVVLTTRCSIKSG